MLKLTILFIALCSYAVHGQRCNARYDDSKTGQCVAANDCQGTSLSVDTCEYQVCCSNNTSGGLSSCNRDQSAFISVYNTSRGRYIFKFLDHGISRAGICSNCRAKAAFLAIAAAMTNDFERDEVPGPSFAFTFDDQRYGNSDRDDGSRYRRRGFFGLRGKDIYERFYSSNRAYNIYSNPELAADPKTAAEIAAILWNRPGLQSVSPLTSLADGTFYGFSMLWEKLYGDDELLADATKKYSMFLRLLNCGGDLYPGQGAECAYNSTHRGFCVPACFPGLEDVAHVCGCNSDTSIACSNSPAHIRCCLDSCNQDLKMDLGLVLDSSGSIGSVDYGRLKQFVVDLLQKMNVGENKTHVAIINYSNYAQILTYLNRDYDLASKVRIVRAAQFIGSGTNTALALREANTVFDYSKGLRLPEEGISQVIFVITDGASDNEAMTLRAADDLKRKGIHIVSVGVGSSLNDRELYAMSTSPSNENYFFITDYTGLQTRVNQFVSKTCSEPVTVPENSTITTDVTKGRYKFLKLKIVVTGKKIMIRAKLYVGKVKLFFSFKTRNPKDPAEFINYFTSSGNQQSTNAPSGSTSSSPLGRFQKVEQKKVDSNQDELLVIDKPDDIDEFDFVYVGVKGVDDQNKFEVSLEDCELVFCPSSASMSNRLSLLFAFICLLVSTKPW